MQHNVPAAFFHLAQYSVCSSRRRCWHACVSACCQELKLPKFCLWHVAWSLNICPAKFHATGKSCQKLILSSMASGIFRKQAKLQAAGKSFQKTNPINFFACCMSNFQEAGKTFLREFPMNYMVAEFHSYCFLVFLKIIFDWYSLSRLCDIF